VPGRYDLAVAIQAPPISNDQRKPLVLTLVVDVTPSMWGLGLTQAQAALATMAASLQKGDRVELVTTASTPSVAIEITGPNDPTLLDSAAKLKIDNEGTLKDALGLAYDAAGASAQGGAWNRVIVLSAGDAPEEAVPEETIAAAAADQQIYLVAAATGSTYGTSERFLAKASRVGRGPYVYLGKNGATEEMFGPRFNELVGYSFDNLELSLALPGHARLLEDGPSGPTVTTNPVAQYIGPGASQLFLFRLQTCAAPPSTDVVGVTVSYTDVDGQTGSVSRDFSFPDANTVAGHAVYDKTAAIVAYVDALRSMDAKRIQYALDAVTHAEQSNTSADDLADLGSMGQLLAQHPALSDPQ
jgi:hypothetical protein